MEATIELLEHIAYKLRVNSLKATTAAGSGHPTSALSAADIVAVLFFHTMHYNLANPYNPHNDRFILSKGHAIPVVYAVWHELGVLSQQELLTLRQFDSPLEGHPTPRFMYNEAATGSLGCGLSIGLGMALSTRVSKKEFHTYVLLGDSEMTEGSVWEAIELAAYYKVDNLIAIVDLNGLGQSTETIDDHLVEQHAKKWQAFGWHAITLNGNNICDIVTALDAAKTVKNKPVVLVACTAKGAGLKEIENKQGYHGKAFSPEQLTNLLEELKTRYPEAATYNYTPVKIIPHIEKPGFKKIELPQPDYKAGDNIATRKAYGETLVALGRVSKNIIVLDAEVKNSTFADLFEAQFPDRFVQAFVAEQNMIGMATGFALRNFTTFSSTFASFLTRAHDQIRMGAIGRVPLRIAGSHAGVSIGQDGPSQMGLEDIAQMRALPESIVLYPADAVSCYKLVTLAANYIQGISYLRLTRAETKVIYNNTQEFTIGGCCVLRESAQDKLCVIAAGITLYQALEAYELLKAEDIYISVIDLYSIKPLDYATILKQAQKAHNKIITVEDHYIQGGLGEAVCYALRNDCVTIEVLAVKELSRSGKPEELMAYHKIDAKAIINTVKKMLD